jgi:hypothetical protein
MGRALLLAVIVVCAGHAVAQGFDITRNPARQTRLFAAADEPAKETNTFEAIQEKSKWRGLGVEVHGGVIASKRSMFTAGVGMSFHLTNTMSLVARLDYNHNIGPGRDYRPQVRGAAVEVGVRFHIDFADFVAFYGTHGINISGQLAYFKLDESKDGTTLGLVTSFGAGTVNVFGLEFGDRTWRGFVESGLRTQFFFLQNSDEDAVEGFEDDIRTDFRFQWIVARIGVRFYF